MLKLPIGYSDFATIVRQRMDFVDKTLWIKEVLDNFNIQVSVIVRPRRFGKTLNLSTLRYFLAAEVNGQLTADLFAGLKIMTCGESYTQQQGKYSVIFLTFKDIKNLSYEEAYAGLCDLISQLYREHEYLSSSAQLTDIEKERFLSILKKQADAHQFSVSLLDLSYYLFKHHGVKPWILIDEYDTPIHAAFFHGYYEKIIDFMRRLFGSCLKDNAYLTRAIITGIMRISKESLFSGLNNVRIYSMLNSPYGEHFGFTELEVNDLLVISQLNNLAAKISHWYNGYQIGNINLYNPWSIINCIDYNGELQPYWVNTSDNALLKQLLARSDSQTKIALESLLQKESITALIDDNIVFRDLETDPDALWSFLLATGYLKVIHVETKGLLKQCELTVPNEEVLTSYQAMVKGWLADTSTNAQYLVFLLSLTEGRIDEFSHYLQKYLLETMSVFDTSGKEPEKFYHGFVLGLIVSLSETHEVQSNRESGYGRYDVILIPKDIEQLGIILEFKTVSDPNQDLQQAAMQAVQQITERRYETILIQKSIHQFLKIGLAFRGKQVVVFSTDVQKTSNILAESTQTLSDRLDG